MSAYRPAEGEFNFATVLDFLSRYLKPILIVTITAGILATIFSMPYFIPPKFESQVILYPATTNSISKAIMEYVPTGKEDLLAFGEEEEAEQILQLLQSQDITNRIVDKYHLMDHYRIDKDGSYPYTKLMRRFKENVNYRRTEYMSIEITVQDEDRLMAANIANDIAALIDSTKNNVQKKRAVDALEIVRKKYEEKQKFIAVMVDSMQKIGVMGVYNLDEQASVLTEQYAKALLSGNTKAMGEIGHEKEILGRYGPVQKSLLDRVEFENEELSKLRTKVEQARVDAETFLPATFVINKAVPAEKKSYPIRWLIVAISMASALALSILFFAFLENIRKYRREKLVREVETRTLVDA